MNLKSSIRVAIDGVRAIHGDGDPAMIVNSVLQASDREAAAIASALALLVSGAMHEMDKLGGDGAADAWIATEFVKLGLHDGS